MRESAIEKSLGRQIKQLNGIYYKFNSPGQAGVPDRIVILPGGKVFFVELKTGRGKTEKIQDWQIQKLRDLGCSVLVLRGKADVDRFVKEVIG